MSRKQQPKPGKPTPAPQPEAETPATEAELHAGVLDELEHEEEGTEGTMASLLEEAEQQTKKLQTRGVTTVRVVHLEGDKVLVDVGDRLEGVVPASDFPEGGLPAVGDEIPVVLEKKGGGDRQARLSHKKARETLGWQRIAAAKESKERLSGQVTRAVKGGFIVDLDGVDAFLPLSHADRRPLRKGDTLAGRTVTVTILEVEAAKRRLVVSRKEVLEQEHADKRRAALEKLKVGQVLEGRVTGVAEFGAFVDAGGVEGMVHISDLAWKPIKHPREAVKPGQKIKVRVLKVELDARKLSLGYKQLLPNPADAMKKKFQRGARVQAKILALTPRGAKAEIDKDTKAFIPSEEFAEAGPPKPGETVQTVAQEVDARSFEVRLSIKRADMIEERERIKQYTRGAPKLTLGDILKPGGGEQ